MRFERSRDWDEIKRIITHPAIWRHCSDDYSPQPQAFQPIQQADVWYVLVRDGVETLGLFMVVPHSTILWEVHTCLLPCCWGPKAAGIAREAARWLFEQTPCQRLITNVPDDNRVALRFAKRAGMKQFGLNPRAWIKGGKLLDVHMLGFNRDEVIPCPQQ